MSDQIQGGDFEGGDQSNEGGAPQRQDRDEQQDLERQQNQQRSEVEKVRTQAERAGGGTNKGSDLGSNEDIDQSGGGQGGGGQE